MKRSLMILSVIALSMVMLVSCGKDKDDSNNTATNPASATAATNANGQATLQLGTYTVTATIQNQAHTGLQGINVSGYLSHNSVLLEAFDSTSTYYPSITVVPLSTVLAMSTPSGRIQSPEQIMNASVAATMILYSVEWAVCGLDTVASFDGIVTDEWTTEQWHTGTLSDMYNIIDTTSLYEHGVFVHLNQTVHNATGSQYRTAVFLPNDIADFATFSSLAGAVFQLFSEDTLHFGELSYSGVALPIMSVDNITMHRNFWAQFTLRWGELPRDIDSHLLTPPINDTTYHVRWDEMGDADSAPYAWLDVDDRQSYGPEHLTIYQHFTGTYTYAVYDWSGDGTIATSDASVTLLKPDGSVQVFNVPTDTAGVQPNWWWHVCTIDGTTGQVTRINMLSPDPPTGMAPSILNGKAFEKAHLKASDRAATR